MLSENPDFTGLLALINERRARVARFINAELIDLYWEVGKQIHQRIEEAGWGRITVNRLAGFLGKHTPGIRGFSASNLWRMRQFCEAWQGAPEKLAPLLRKLPWSSLLDLRKPHENPSIGILLCASKDDGVIEYALSRSLSPALVAEYQTKLPDKALLQAKLHEFLEANASF